MCENLSSSKEENKDEAVAKLAERRRQARERAQREAEEAARRAEEERQGVIRHVAVVERHLAVKWSCVLQVGGGGATAARS